MSNDRLHIICGNCGHDATDGNFTWRYIPKEDYGNGEFESADVFIHCRNCCTLHALGKYMSEESEEEDDLEYATIFDRITSSPEVLAEKLVYPTYGIISRTWDFEKDDWGTAEPSWSSAVMPSNLCYGTRADAIAATVARLKEVDDAAEM